MSAVDALFWVVCLVLVVAGVAKLTDPEPVATTLAALGVRRPGVARALGVVEVLAAVVAMAVGGRVAAIVVGVLYAGFAVVVVLARRRGLESCGCFGAQSTPPSRLHVAVNAGSAAVAGAAAWVGGPLPVADGLGELGGIGVVVGGLVLLAAIGVVVVDTIVAEVVEETRALRVRNDPDVTVEGT